MTSSLRILYDHQIFSQQNHGGISRYFVELFRHLKAISRAEPEIAVRVSSNHYLDQLDVPGRGHLFGKRWFRGRNRLQHLINERYTRKVMERDQFDVFHPTYYDPYFLDCLHGKPFVLTVYDLTHQLFPDLFPLEPHFADWVRSTVSESARIITISQHTKKDLLDFYPSSRGKIEVIPLAALLDPNVGDRLPTLLPAKYLLFVGHRGSYKNFELFVRLSARLIVGTTRLFVVCVGGGAFSKNELRMFDGLGLRERMLRIDVADSQLSAIYASALCLVYPSMYEGFGLPILEAFAAGCPVVANRVSAIPEVGGEAVAYFHHDNQDSLIDTLRAIIDDEDFRVDLRNKGLNRARLFSWEDTARKTLRTYLSVSGGS